MTSKDHIEPDEGVAIPGVQRERIWHPTFREARISEMIGHLRFRALHWDATNRLWHVDHVPADALDFERLARISSGNLDNLLTVWESLVDGWDEYEFTVVE